MAKQKTTASVHERVNGLEKWLDGVYAKTPALPVGARDWLANNIYWLAAIGGVLGLWGAYSLWRVAQWSDGLVQYTNEAARYYGTAPVGADFGVILWVVLAVAVVQGVLALMAVGPLKSHRKSGWNLLFYSALLSVVMGVLYLFTNDYGMGSFLGSLLGSAIGLYFLFQIRSRFAGA
jgi:hypothetical protein